MSVPAWMAMLCPTVMRYPSAGSEPSPRLSPMSPGEALPVTTATERPASAPKSSASVAASSESCAV